MNLGSVLVATRRSAARAGRTALAAALLLGPLTGASGCGAEDPAAPATGDDQDATSAALTAKSYFAAGDAVTPAADFTGTVATTLLATVSITDTWPLAPSVV